MPQRRFFVPKHIMTGPSLVLPPEQAHHLRDVLRLRAGDPVELFDGQGNAYEGFVEDCGREVRIGRLARLESSPRPPRQVALAPALIKLDRFEWMLEKATELGVSEFIPILTRRCNVRIQEHRIDERWQRWKRITAEASRQCGRSDLPTVRQPMEFQMLLRSSLLPPARLFLYKGSARLLGTESIAAAGTLLCIGPEGGWDPDEIEAAASAGFEALSLGPPILRSETAAVAAAALLLLRTAETDERRA